LENNEYLQKAADQGDAIAQSKLGWYYKFGIGVPKDLKKKKKSFEYLQKSASKRMNMVYKI